MKKPSPPHGTIVVGIDGSAPSTRAADWAADLAWRERRALTVVHSSDPFSFEQGGVWSGWGAGWDELRRRAEASYGEAVTATLERTHERHPELVVHVVEEYVDPRLTLTELSEHAHLLVVGSHGRGPVATTLLGSVSAGVARTAQCPTVVVRPAPDETERDGVAIVVDRLHPCETTVEFAFRHASTVRLPLRVVLCHDDRDHQHRAPTPEQLQLELSELGAGLREKFPDVDVDLDVHRGAIEDVLVATTVTADLTVMGRRPHHGLTRLARSSLTTLVLEHARGPVVIVPERKHES